MTVFWKVYVENEGYPDARPVLVSMSGRRTSKRIQLDDRHEASNFRVLLGPDDLSETPEDARRVWAARSAGDVTDCREGLAEAIAMEATEVQTEGDA